VQAIDEEPLGLEQLAHHALSMHHETRYCSETDRPASGVVADTTLSVESTLLVGLVTLLCADEVRSCAFRV